VYHHKFSFLQADNGQASPLACSPAVQDSGSAVRAMLNTLAANLAADLACLTSWHSAMVPDLVPEIPSCLSQPAQLLGARAPRHPAPRNGRRASSLHAGSAPISKLVIPSNPIPACDGRSPPGQQSVELHAQWPLISGCRGPAASKAGTCLSSPEKPTVQQMVAQIMTPSRAEGRRRLRERRECRPSSPGGNTPSQATAPKVMSKRQADLRPPCSGFALNVPVKAQPVTLSPKFEMACGHGMDQTFRSAVPLSVAFPTSRGNDNMGSSAANEVCEDAYVNERWVPPSPASDDVQGCVPEVHLRSSSPDSCLLHGGDVGGHSIPMSDLLSRPNLDDGCHQQPLLPTLRSEPRTPPPRLHMPRTPPRCGSGRRPPLIRGSDSLHPHCEQEPMSSVF